MVLIDAIYVNNGGGKVLLEYLIQELNVIDSEFTYLLDSRYDGILPNAKCKVHKLRPSLFNRHLFYLKYSKLITKVFCFGNVPPTVRLGCTVFTYFHQYLFLVRPKGLNFINSVLIRSKQIIIKLLKNNTNFWIVQNALVSEKLGKVMSINRSNILITPFFRSFVKQTDFNRKKQYLYVSSGEPHKNHLILIEAFKMFYDKFKLGSLHLTIPLKYSDILDSIGNNYPIYNYHKLDEFELSKLYFESEYFIFPSKFESFGLGIVEAIECGCKIVGADLPYLHHICSPSVVFDPDSLVSIYTSFEKSYFGELKDSRLKVSNEIEKLLNLLKSE